jgi:hypothetical protein
MNKIVILFCCIAAFSPASYAQSIIRTGDKSINHALMRKMYTSFKITMYDSLGNARGDILEFDYITIDTTKKLLTRAQHVFYPGGFIKLDSTIADLITLAPVRMRMITSPANMQMDLTFHESSVHAVVNRNNVLKDTVHTMESGYFDSNLIEYIIGFLPFKEGYSASLNAYTFEKDGMDPYKVEYLGKDVLPATKGFCNLVRVTSDNVIRYAWYEAGTGNLIKYVIPYKGGLMIMTRA